jgi:hypothetical protein
MEKIVSLLFELGLLALLGVLYYYYVRAKLLKREKKGEDDASPEDHDEDSKN